MEQFFTNSWFSQEHIPNVVNITKGSSAGTPMADLIYSMAMSRVLKCLADSLAKEDLESSIVQGAFHHNGVETSFVDDVGIPCISPAGDLLQKAGRVASVAFRVFQIFGMALNFKPGKSEAIVGFFGPGCKSGQTSVDGV